MLQLTKRVFNIVTYISTYVDTYKYALWSHRWLESKGLASAQLPLSSENYTILFKN